MLLVSTRVLGAAVKITDADDTRGLGCVAVYPDGVVVATDGHRLVRFSPVANPAGFAEEFDGFDLTDPGWLDRADGLPLLLPADTVRALLRAVRPLAGTPSQLERRPALGLLRIGEAPEGFAAWGVWRSAILLPGAKVGHDYPLYERIWPKRFRADVPGCSVVSLNSRYLADVLRTFGDSSGVADVVESTAAASDSFTRRTTIYTGKDPARAILFYSTGGPYGIEAAGLVMPLRMPDNSAGDPWTWIEREAAAKESADVAAPAGWAVAG